LNKAPEKGSSFRRIDKDLQMDEPVELKKCVSLYEKQK
jgi:hypothetical protein